MDVLYALTRLFQNSLLYLSIRFFLKYLWSKINEKQLLTGVMKRKVADRWISSLGGKISSWRKKNGGHFFDYQPRKLQVAVSEAFDTEVSGNCTISSRVTKTCMFLVQSISTTDKDKTKQLLCCQAGGAVLSLRLPLVRTWNGTIYEAGRKGKGSVRRTGYIEEASKKIDFRFISFDLINFSRWLFL